MARRRPWCRDGDTNELCGERLRVRRETNIHHVRLPAFLTFRMTFGQYLVFQAVGSTVVNGILNALGTFPARQRAWLPLWGADGIARDTYLTSLLLSGLTVLVGSLFVALDVHTGRVAPHVMAPSRHRWFHWLAAHVVARALLSAAVFTALFAPPTLFALAKLGIEAMSFHDFFVFKVTYAVLLGAIVTPINAAAVLIEKGDRLPQSTSGGA
jgi:hypothetical protein